MENAGRNTSEKPSLEQQEKSNVGNRPVIPDSAQAPVLAAVRPVVEAKVDTTLVCRYELKYLVSEAAAMALERYVAEYLPIDRFSALYPDGFYPIVSLYMDSPDMRLCRESMTGVLNRIKLRIRGYSDNPSDPRFFEIKRRANAVIFKSRAKVSDESIPPLVAGRYLPPIHNTPKDVEALKMYQLYMLSLNAKPVMLIRYMRKAYEGKAENRVRITFDNELCFKTMQEPIVRFGGEGWQRSNVSLKGIIVEIKFTGYFPAWLNRMVQLFNLRQRSMSKYATSVESACLLRFCAPKLPFVAQEI